jgi:hypothetical protein
LSVSDPNALDAVTVMVSTPSPLASGDIETVPLQEAAAVKEPLAPEGDADQVIVVGVLVAVPESAILPVAVTVRVNGKEFIATTGGLPAGAKAAKASAMVL